MDYTSYNLYNVTVTEISSECMTGGSPIYGDGKIEIYFVQADEKNYSVTIDANGGTVSGTNPFNVTYGKNTGNDLHNYSFTKNGYTFDGLWTSANGGICVWDSNGYAVRGQRSSTYWIGGEDTGYSDWMGGSYSYWPS